MCVSSNVQFLELNSIFYCKKLLWFPLKKKKNVFVNVDRNVVFLVIFTKMEKKVYKATIYLHEVCDTLDEGRDSRHSDCYRRALAACGNSSSQ